MNRRSRSMPRWLPQVDGQALLVGIERGEDRPSLPVAILRLGHAADEAGPVGPGGRFEVDHLGAEQGEHVAGQRAGPVRRHVQDPQALEREAVRRCRCVCRLGVLRRRRARRSSAAPSRGAGSGAGGGPTPAGTAGGDSPRRPGVGGEAPRARKCSKRRDVGAVGDRRVGDPEGRRQVEHLVDRVRGDPRVDRRGQRRPVEEERGSSIHSGCSDHGAEVEPLLPRPDPEPDQPVAGGADTRGRDETLAPHRPARAGR